MNYADLILPLPLPKLYTYKIPDNMNGICIPGKRVIVQFGKKKIYTGIVRRTHNNKPEYETKNIVSVLDSEAIISELQFKFWEWVSKYYMCSTGDVYKAALPSGMKLQSETNILKLREAETGEINEKEEAVLLLLDEKKGRSVSDLTKNTDFNVLPLIKKMIDKKIVSAEEWIKKVYKAKSEIFISLSEKLTDSSELEQALETIKKAPKQTELLMNFIYLSKYGSDKFEGLEPFNEIIKSNLIKQTECGTAVLNALIEKGFLISEKREVERLSRFKKDENVSKTLNEYQIQAISEIKSQFIEKDAVLLHGVTSSGKTEIYINLIKEQIENGKQVLYLLPEIALTAQIINRLKDIFGAKVGIYHSKFNDAERVEIWNNLQKNDTENSYKIILGVRSSVFLPFKNLGLIIVDEEHENTYKQYSPAPRYNARDSAVVIAKLHGAKVLLGTATPSIESYYNAKTGKYGLVEVFNRYKDIQLPEVLIADTRLARKRKQMKSLFAPLMMENLTKALDNKEQIILFQNRRGFSPFMECETCGWIPKCDHCDVSLTYHKYSEQLTCHYCGFSYKSTEQCKACGDTSMSTRGFGTEKIEDEIAELFPGVNTARMDFDSTRSKKAYHKIISDFENHRTDILIGTQMVSKGLDFDNVSVVGIMNADNMLNFPDFRAYERAFQLMAQVSGRAGRKNKRGRVIIQTSDKNHPIIHNVIENDYNELFQTQIEERQLFKYPPYYRLIKMVLKHKKQYILDKAADKTADNLKNIFGNRVLGPEYPVISRVKNWYIKNILIKIERQKSVDKAKELIKNAVNTVKSDEKYKYVQFIYDVDPM